MSQAKKEGGFYIEKLNLGSKRNVSSTSLSGGKLNFHFKTKSVSLSLTRYEEKTTSCDGSDREYEGNEIFHLK